MGPRADVDSYYLTLLRWPPGCPLPSIYWDLRCNGRKGSEAEVDSSIQRMHHCENVLFGIAEIEGNTERASVSLTLASDADWHVSHAAPAAPDRLRIRRALRTPRRTAGRGGPVHSNA